jgi:methionyl-tRNA synthetase
MCNKSNIFVCPVVYLLASQGKLFIQVDKAKHHYENLLLSSACESVLEIGNLGNLYIDEQAPWSCFKKGGESTEKAAKVNI